MIKRKVVPEIPVSVRVDAHLDWTSPVEYFTRMHIPDVELKTEIIEAMYFKETGMLKDAGIVVSDQQQHTDYSSPKMIECARKHLRRSKSKILSVTKGKCLISRLDAHNAIGEKDDKKDILDQVSKRLCTSNRRRRKSPSKSPYSLRNSPSKSPYSLRKKSPWEKTRCSKSPSKYMSDPEMDFPNKYGGVANWASSLRS